MNPDEAYMEKQLKAEEEKLGRKVQALSDADRKEIYEKGSKHFTGFSLICSFFSSLRLQRDQLVLEPLPTAGLA